MRPFDDISRLEQAQILDGPVGALRALVSKALPSRRVRDVLHGVWLGHPLHPVLAQLALGSFVSAGVLDLLPGNDRAARALIRVGVLSSLPTAAAGLADWSQAHKGQQRVGLVHGGTNVLALVCYLRSLGARRRGRHLRGVLWGMLGLFLGTAGATLGGHLAYHQATGTNRDEEVRYLGPGDWQPAGTVTELPEGEPVRRLVGEVPVFLLRRGTSVIAMSDRCPHLSAPLHEGELSGSDGQHCVVCPWHGSTFRLADGAVVHGPATAPVPMFETRQSDGRLEIRVRTIKGVPAS